MNLEEGSPIITGLLTAYNEVQKHKQEMDKTIDDAMNKIRLARDLLLITGQIIKEERRPKPLPEPQPKRKDYSTESETEEEEEDLAELPLDSCVQYIWDRVLAAMEELDSVIAKFSADDDSEITQNVRAAHMHLRRANNFINEMFENNQMGNDPMIRFPSYMMSEIEALRDDVDTKLGTAEPEEKEEKPKQEASSESESDENFNLHFSSSDSETPPKEPAPQSKPTVVDRISDMIEGSSDSEGKPEVPYKCLLVKKNKVVIAKWYFKYRKCWHKALKTARLFDAHKYMKKIVNMLESPTGSLTELKDNVENAIKACRNWIKISTPEDFDWINGQAILKQLTKMEWVVDEAISA